MISQTDTQGGALPAVNAAQIHPLILHTYTSQTPKKRRDRRGHARYSNLGDLCAEKGASHAPRMVSQAIEQASIGGQ
jgi:hypothetical protein